MGAVFQGGADVKKLRQEDEGKADALERGQGGDFAGLFLAAAGLHEKI
jgi:hypothetical protein